MIISGLSGLIWAQDALEIDHLYVSPNGFKVATVFVKSEAVGWIAETDKCAKSEKFGRIEPQAGGFRALIEAGQLAQGKNQLFACSQKTDGTVTEAKPFIITRDDSIPRIALKPAPGEFGKLPEIQIDCENAVLSYSLNGNEPNFDLDGKIKTGQKYDGTIKLEQKVVTIQVRAISTAGAISPVTHGEYSENKRLSGWNAWDIYLGGAYVSTTGSVKPYLPSGAGMMAGVRRGLDDIFAPGISEINNRSSWLPGIFAEGQFLGLKNSPYSENIITLIAGPEWQFAITNSRNLTIVPGIGAGFSQISVNTPTYNSAGITTALQGKIGIEYHLHIWAIFAQIRYVYFADQISPLSGVGFVTGLIYKI